MIYDFIRFGSSQIYLKTEAYIKTNSNIIKINFRFAYGET